MQIFEVIEGEIQKTDKTTGYVLAQVVNGGYGADVGFFVNVLMQGTSATVRFSVGSQVLLGDLIQLFLNGETIGVIFHQSTGDLDLLTAG